MKKCQFLLFPLLFSACVDVPEPVTLVEQFKQYDPVQKSCIELSKDLSEDANGILVFEDINKECARLIEALEGANTAYVTMNRNKNNAAYYSAKEKYKKEKNRLKIQHEYVNLKLKSKGLDAIENDDLELFSKVIGFSYHPMNLSYYNYMRKHKSKFMDNKKLLHFEKKYAAEKYATGYALVNKGKYTQGLTDLSVAAKMKNIKASKLCGDVFMDLYPSKALMCYQLAIELGDTSSLYPLAKYYEEDENLDEARKWYMKSADAGNFISQYKLYKLDPENSKQVQWLKKSADSGYDKAQYEYGLLLSQTNKKKESKHYLQKALAQNYSEASYPLGKIYFDDGEFKRAYTLLSDGDENADSMYKLGYLKEHGKGTCKNYYAASAYYEKAKKLGKKDADKDLYRVNKAKKQLQSRQVSQQKMQAKSNIEQIRANRRRLDEIAREDMRIRGQWQTKKEEAVRLKAQACGAEPDNNNLRRSGERIHLEGTVSNWLSKTAFIINVGGSEYYVKDEGDRARVNKGDDANIVAISTGKREITQGLRRSLFEAADETAIQKAYAFEFEGICPY